MDIVTDWMDTGSEASLFDMVANAILAAYDQGYDTGFHAAASGEGDE